MERKELEQVGFTFGEIPLVAYGRPRSCTFDWVLDQRIICTMVCHLLYIIQTSINCGKGKDFTSILEVVLRELSSFFCCSYIYSQSSPIHILEHSIYPTIFHFNSFVQYCQNNFLGQLYHTPHLIQVNKAII